MKLTTEPVIFLYTVIFTINTAVLPQLVLHKVCMQHSFTNSTVCEPDHLKKFPKLQDEIQKRSSWWWFIILCVNLCFSVFTIMIWGPVTDVIGRRAAILLVPVFSGLQALAYLLNSYFVHASPAFLLIGAALSPLYGEFQGVVAVCYSYIADCTVGSIEQRTAKMAIVEACIFYAGIPGGLLSAFLLKQLGYVSCFVAVIIISVIIFLYAMFLLPQADQVGSLVRVSSSSRLIQDETSEKLSGDRNVNDTNQEDNSKSVISSKSSKIRNSHINPLRQIRQVFLVLLDPSSRRLVLPLLAAFAFSICAVNGELMVTVLYLKNRPFSLSEETLGYYLALQALIRGTGVVALTQISLRLLKLSDWTIICFGLLSQVLNYLLVGLARSVAMVFTVALLGLLVPAATSAIRSHISKQVSSSNYGSILAAIEVMDAVAAVVTNCLSLWSYSLTLAFYSGVVYFVLSGFAALSLIIVLISYLFVRN